MSPSMKSPALTNQVRFFFSSLPLPLVSLHSATSVSLLYDVSRWKGGLVQPLPAFHKGVSISQPILVCV